MNYLKIIIPLLDPVIDEISKKIQAETGDTGDKVVRIAVAAIKGGLAQAKTEFGL